MASKYLGGEKKWIWGVGDWRDPAITEAEMEETQKLRKLTELSHPTQMPTSAIWVLTSK
jgi:hypothetical protein